MTFSFRPSNAFAALAGPPFSDPVEPADFPVTKLRYRNDAWAARIGLDGLSDADWINHFARFAPFPESLPQPQALRYHGHQFRTYNPEIGDGRGFLFAQCTDDAARLLDFGTKGSGQTPYSRTGDGRLTLKGAVREILATEMLEALGVYTSKTFSVAETGEQLWRGDEPSPTRSAVLVRLGHSHIRFGAFQRLGYEGDKEAIRRLIDYCVTHFDPDLDGLVHPEKTEAFFDRIVRRTARLAAQWMAAGFVHGVLNTDNMNVTGESFDYGPWRFLPHLDLGFTAAYFDQTGLYAYGRQPDAAVWNLSRLGGVFSLVTDAAPLNAALAHFPQAFEAAMVEAFFARLGITPPEEDAYGFVIAWMQWLEQSRAPFEQAFFDWFAGAASEARAMGGPNAALYAEPAFAEIRARLAGFDPVRPDRLHHDYFKWTAPATLLIDEVEALWAPIAEEDDWSAFDRKIADIRTARAAYGFDASAFVREPALAPE